MARAQGRWPRARSAGFRHNPSLRKVMSPPPRNTTATSAEHNNEVKLFVLDTNVLLHDPTSLFRFEEHDICLPMFVLEELDNKKKGMTEVARNARQASRFWIRSSAMRRTRSRKASRSNPPRT